MTNDDGTWLVPVGYLHKAHAALYPGRGILVSADVYRAIALAQQRVVEASYRIYGGDTPYTTMYTDSILPIMEALRALVPPSRYYVKDVGFKAALALYGKWAFTLWLRPRVQYELSPDSLRWAKDGWEKMLVADPLIVQRFGHLGGPSMSVAPPAVTGAEKGTEGPLWDAIGSPGKGQATRVETFLLTQTGIEGWTLTVQKDKHWEDYSVHILCHGVLVSSGSEKKCKDAVYAAVTSWKLRDFVWTQRFEPTMGTIQTGLQPIRAMLLPRGGTRPGVPSVPPPPEPGAEGDWWPPGFLDTDARDTTPVEPPEDATEEEREAWGFPNERGPKDLPKQAVDVRSPPAQSSGGAHPV